MNDDEQLAQRASAVDTQGRQIYGDDTWTTMCNAIGRQGITPQALAPVVMRGDAVSRLAEVGQEAMLSEMQNGRPSDAFVKECNSAYSLLRSRQREEHAKIKGRR